MSFVLLNDFKMQWQDIQCPFMEAVSRVGASGYLVLGQEVKDFESDLSSYWGMAHSIGCANGLDAIEIGLRCLGLKAGDKVLTTPLSAFATTLAILRIGAIPVFIDVDDSGLIDLNIADGIFRAHSDIRYFVPVHLYGQSLNLKKLAQLKEEFSLKIVEDCAQSIGAKSFGLANGTVGQVAATSFYPTKNLGAYGDGGALLTQSKELADQARCLRDYGQSQKYVHSEYGLNSRLDELQAAVLKSAMLPRLPGWTLKRIEIAKYYLSHIRHPKIKMPVIQEGSDPVWHLFPTLVSQRDSLMNHLKSQGVSSGVHYPILIPDQELLKTQKNTFKFETLSALVKAKMYASTELSLPIHPYLTQSEIDSVVSACNSWKE